MALTIRNASLLSSRSMHGPDRPSLMAPASLIPCNRFPGQLLPRPNALCIDPCTHRQTCVAKYSNNFKNNPNNNSEDSNKFLSIPTGLGVMALLGFALITFPITSTTVPAGFGGIVGRFGVVSERVLAPGIQWKTLLSRVELFSLKTVLIEVTQDVPTTDGLIVQLDVSVLYHLEPTKVKDLYTSIGVDYERVLVNPEVTSTIRSLTSRVSAKALYSEGRDELSTQITETLNEKLNPRGISVEQVLLRKVVLPDTVTRAIEEKLKAEQESQRMEFILLKEQQEAERKRIEAKGVSDFQKIVSDGISDELLKWKGIEATEKLAYSNNAKVVIIGSSKDGLPLILGGGN